MTKFRKAQFEYFGGYLHYITDAQERKFIARFKHCPRDRVGFVSFLSKNFTVEEYFNSLEVEKKTPVKILEEKGYVSTTVKNLLRQAGYPETIEGRNAMINDRIEKISQEEVA